MKSTIGDTLRKELNDSGEFLREINIIYYKSMIRYYKNDSRLKEWKIKLSNLKNEKNKKNKKNKTK